MTINTGSDMPVAEEVFSVLFSFAIILKRMRESVALLWLSSWCLVDVGVMWLFLTVPWMVCSM